MAGLNDWRHATQREIERYPPQRPTVSGYRRTGTLGRAWSSSLVKGLNAIVAVVGSNPNVAPYAKWVQGQDSQAREMKRRGWHTIEDVGEDEWDKRKRGFRAKLERAGKGGR